MSWLRRTLRLGDWDDDEDDDGPVVDIWAAGSLAVFARWGERGWLVIEGQDLAPPHVDEDDDVTEYEYTLSIHPREVRKLLRALLAPDDADALRVLEQRGADLVRTGETRWLNEHGIQFEFWARYG